MHKERALLFGAGKNCANFYSLLSRLYTVVGIADNSPAKWDTLMFDFRVCSAESIGALDYDIIIVTPQRHDAIIEQLVSAGVERNIIFTLEAVLTNSFQRMNRLRMNRLNIAVFLYGGIGDVLIGMNWLYHLKERYGFEFHNVVIDAFIEDNGTSETKRQILSSCEIISDINTRDLLFFSPWDSNDYDLVFHFCVVPYVQHIYGEKLAALHPELLDYALKLQEFGLHNYCYGFCHSPCFYKTLRRIFEKYPQKQYHSFCDLFDDLNITEEYLCSFPKSSCEEAYLNELGLEKKKYILIDSTMNHYPNPIKSTRAWLSPYWLELVKLIKEEFPTLKVVQIGSNTESELAQETHLDLSGKTNLDQLKALLSNALLLVDYEGGLVHMRHILRGGPSVVLFGPTSIEQHRYSENINIRADVNCPACEWLTPTWLNDCPKGFDPPMCMGNILPITVYREIKNYLNS